MNLINSILINILKVCTNLSIMIYMLIILMVSACFFGRRVEITRKIVFATGGVWILNVIVSLAMIFRLIPDGIDADVMLIGITYLYMFVFYFCAFQDKKLFNVIWAVVFLHAFQLYSGFMLLFTFIYFTGGKWEAYEALLNRTGPAYYQAKLCESVGMVILGTLLALYLYFAFYRKKICYVIRLRDRLLCLVWVLTFASIFIIPFTTDGDQPAERYQSLCTIFGFLAPLFGLIAPVVLIMSASRRVLKEKNEYQERYLEAELEYVKHYKETQTQTKAFRHDVINQLSLASMLLEKGKTQEAAKQLQDMLGSVQALSPKYVTGDEMLDCIVSMKAEKMKELGIEFREEGVIDGNLNMKPMDVCAIFANTLDNAIEAAGSSEVANPQISMIIKRTPQFYVINVLNSVKGKVNIERIFSVEGYTSKKNGEEHGFGLRNIQRHVEKYDGLIKAQSMEGEFSLSIMIPKSEAKTAAAKA